MDEHHFLPSDTFGDAGQRELVQTIHYTIENSNDGTVEATDERVCAWARVGPVLFMQLLRAYDKWSRLWHTENSAFHLHTALADQTMSTFELKKAILAAIPSDEQYDLSPETFGNRAPLVLLGHINTAVDNEEQENPETEREDSWEADAYVDPHMLADLAARSASRRWSVPELLREMKMLVDVI